MVELPPELWLYIAEFIPDRELRNLLDVSRVFYEVALNVRYNEITIEGMDSRTAALLKRLRQVDWLRIPYINNVRILIGTQRLRAESCG